MNKNWLYRMLLFVGAIITGTELSRYYYWQSSLDLIESGSYLAEFINETDNRFDLYHITTNYLPMLGFCLVIVLIVKSSAMIKSNQLVFPSVTALLASISLFLFSEEYYEFCEGWLFTNQIGIVISYYFATLFIVKELHIRRRLTYLILAFFFHSLFAQAMQPIITQIGYDFSYFPYGKMESIIIAFYLAVSGLYYLLYQKKVMD